MKERGVIKYGVGYDIIVVDGHAKLILGIKCHKCNNISFHPKDIKERYCGFCHVFHEEHLLDHEA